MVQESKYVGKFVNGINNRVRVVDCYLDTLQGILDTNDDNEPSPKKLPVNNQGRSDKNEKQNKESTFGK